MTVKLAFWQLNTALTPRISHLHCPPLCISIILEHNFFFFCIFLASSSSFCFCSPSKACCLNWYCGQLTYPRYHRRIRSFFHSSSTNLIGTLTEWSVCIRGDREHTTRSSCKKAQYCLLVHSNQAELLPAHWDLFRSSRLSLHHWQQVWKQWSHCQEMFHIARLFFFSSSTANHVCWSWFVFIFQSSDHSCLNVSDVVRLMGANRAEKKVLKGVIVKLSRSQREHQVQSMCQPHWESSAPL